MRRENILFKSLLFAGILACLFIWCLHCKFLALDEGVWDYIGQLWAHGVAPYTAAVENKLPGICYLYLFSNLLFGTTPYFVRVLAVISVTAALVPLRAMARDLGGEKAANAVSFAYVLIACTEMTAPWEIVSTESFIILFEALAFMVYFRARRTSPAHAFAAGCLCGVAVMFKQVAVLGFFALLSAPVLWHGINRRAAKDMALMFCGCAATGILLSLPVLMCGTTVAQYYDAVVALPFSTSSRFAGHFTLSIPWDRWLPFAPIFVCCVIFACRRPRIVLPFLLWLAADFAGVNATGHYYLYEFRLLAASLALCSGVGFASLFPDTEERNYAGKILAASFVLLAAACSGAATASFNSETKTNYTNRSASHIRMIAEEIRSMTAQNDRIFVYSSDGHCIYSYAGRLPAARLFCACLVPGREGEVLADLSAHPPAVIAVKESVPWLEAYLKNRKYEFVKSLYGVSLFRRPGAARIAAFSDGGAAGTAKNFALPLS